MRTRLRKISAGALLSLSLACSGPLPGAAQEAPLKGAGSSMEQHLRTQAALQGKRVAWIPLSMAIPLTLEWTRIMREELEPLGVKMTVHDTNWSTSSQTQVFSSLIAERPDLIVVQNLTVGTLARQIEQAEKAGIPVMQVQMQANTKSDVFVGGDWYAYGVKMADAVGQACTAPGKSGKIAIVEGEPSADAVIGQLRGITDTLKAKYASIKVVSDQAANWDSNKAFDITSAVLQQNPDLCGIVGMWGIMMIGSAQAVKQAGLAGKVFLTTSSEASRPECDLVEGSLFNELYTYNATRNGYAMSDMVRFMLQYYDKGKNKPGSFNVALYTPITVIRKDENYNRSMCFDPPASK